MSAFIMASGTLVRVDDVKTVDYQNIESGYVIIHTTDGDAIRANDFDAVEVMMTLKPGALEGKRLRWLRGAWAWHNFVIHPVMQIMVWLGFTRRAIALHDNSVPKPTGFRHKK